MLADIQPSDICEERLPLTRVVFGEMTRIIPGPHLIDATMLLLILSYFNYLGIWLQVPFWEFKEYVLKLRDVHPDDKTELLRCLRRMGRIGLIDFRSEYITVPLKTKELLFRAAERSKAYPKQIN